MAKNIKKPSAFDLLGTLPDWAVKEYIKKGIIKIDPLPKNWGESVDEVTIDFHLGNKLRVFSMDGMNTIGGFFPWMG
ncbi:hypothetical protein HYW43_01060 [Candidatus Daviesbacteria bacterium]|nr:hypothetical protein [Candidatus Daviesbacteria bacterium]